MEVNRFRLETTDARSKNRERDTNGKSYFNFCIYYTEQQCITIPSEDDVTVWRIALINQCASIDLRAVSVQLPTRRVRTQLHGGFALHIPAHLLPMKGM